MTIKQPEVEELIIESGRSEKNYWMDLWRFRELFYILSWRDIKVLYKQTVIGAAWGVIRPLLTMVIFTFVFGKLGNLDQRARARRRGGDLDALDQLRAQDRRGGQGLPLLHTSCVAAGVDPEEAVRIALDALERLRIGPPAIGGPERPTLVPIADTTAHLEVTAICSSPILDADAFAGLRVREQTIAAHQPPLVPLRAVAGSRSAFRTQPKVFW